MDNTSLEWYWFRRMSSERKKRNYPEKKKIACQMWKPDTLFEAVSKEF